MNIYVCHLFKMIFDTFCLSIIFVVILSIIVCPFKFFVFDFEYCIHSFNHCCSFIPYISQSLRINTPLSGCSIPSNIDKRVVFPQPLSPIIKFLEPASISMLTSLSILCIPSYDFVKFLPVIIKFSVRRSL